jgi:hypothetical protein
MTVEGNGFMDSTLINTQICRTVEIWNNGQLPLTVTSATSVGLDNKDFVVSGATFPLTIQPMTKADVQVCGKPSDRGERTASLEVVGMSGDRTTTIDLPLNVYGLLACSTPDGTSLFASEIVKLGTSKTEQVVITNCGDVPVTYTGSITGQGYTITNAATSGVIAPGGTYTYDVQYSASTMSLQPGKLKVATSTPSVADMMIDLAGTGGNSILAATNTTANTNGDPVDFDVTVTNSGNFDWSVGAPVVSGAEFVLKASPASITASNGTGNFTFTFTPNPGDVTHQANVTFPNSDNTTFTFVVKGIVGSNDVATSAANGYELRQNYPNPMMGKSTIAFTMGEAGQATIMISDITGNVVATIANGFFAKGENTVTFDGSMLTSGTYFYELTAGSTRLQRAMTIKK